MAPSPNHTIHKITRNFTNDAAEPIGSAFSTWEFSLSEGTAHTPRRAVSKLGGESLPCPGIFAMTQLCLPISFGLRLINQIADLLTNAVKFAWPMAHDFLGLGKDARLCSHQIAFSDVVLRASFVNGIFCRKSRYCSHGVY